jgi:hypothetical protein
MELCQYHRSTQYTVLDVQVVQFLVKGREKREEGGVLS